MVIPLAAMATLVRRVSYVRSAGGVPRKIVRRHFFGIRRTEPDRIVFQGGFEGESAKLARMSAVLANHYDSK